MELNLVQKQTQTLSPMMVQSMEILQMGAQELTEFVDRGLQENPVLEREEQFDSGREDPELLRRKLEWLESNDRQNQTYYQQDDEDAPLQNFGVDAGQEETLYAHILSSFRAWIWNPRSVRGSSSWPRVWDRAAGWMNLWRPWPREPDFPRLR